MKKKDRGAGGVNEWTREEQVDAQGDICVHV
jgi:hypothetical protein